MAADDTTFQRRFAVNGLAEAASRAHMVDGLSFVDAALAFVEDWHSTANRDDAVSLIVEDCETGERQCFRVDLESGETAPCD
jgi:hypothetical protein